jgi:hypothetical protein
MVESSPGLRGFYPQHEIYKSFRKSGDMMDLSRLTKPAVPWFHLLAAAPDDARDALRALERGGARVAVRFVRGRKATTAAAFFDEAAAALQFPDYFGENWDALHDCLDDLAWLHADAIVLGLLDAGRLLAGSPSDEAARHLVTVLRAVTERRNKPGKGKTPHPYHVVFQAVPAEADAAAHRWHALGLSLQRL